jgi:hypothetical protein
MTPSGIDPATFRFVAQCLNHCATACPHIFMYSREITTNFTNVNRVTVDLSVILTLHSVTSMVIAYGPATCVFTLLCTYRSFSGLIPCLRTPVKSQLLNYNII